MNNNIFKSNNIPKIYAYTEPNSYANTPWKGKRSGKGLWKIGDTYRTAKERVKEQYSTKRPDANIYKIGLEELAIRNDGTFFRDYQVHKVLENSGVTRIKTKTNNKNGQEQLENTEWFECTLEEIKRAILTVKQRKTAMVTNSADFTMRPEQKAAVNMTSAFFRQHSKEKEGYAPHFLWNAKMRFGKCFTSYQLAKEMGWKKIVVLTFKPAVQSSWQADLRHIDFEGWQFVGGTSADLSAIDYNKPFVCFKSFQDVLGKTDAGGIKAKNEDIHLMNWDLIILDEYHFGAWRDNAKDLYAGEDRLEQKEQDAGGLDYYDEKQMPLTTKAYLYLSGTPFRALQEGDFMEYQIFNWTYSDEQEQKQKYVLEDNNPYAELPQMVLLTYKMPEELINVAIKEELNEFDLNEFFKAKIINNEKAQFEHEEEVGKWLNLLIGQYLPSAIDKLKNKSKIIMPYSPRLSGALDHTFWYLPSVASCKAMKELLDNHTFFKNYKTICCAGNEAGIGLEALKPVEDNIGNGCNTRTITLSCGKLTTGVTVPQWSAILMLRSTASPESYFQAAFRVQSPWTVKNPAGTNPNEKEIIKETCYVFDFAPNRALKEIVDYCTRLKVGPQSGIEDNIKEFTKFLPVIACADGDMDFVSPEDLLHIFTTGIGSAMLARKWDSNKLLNISDNNILKKLLQNEDALKALEKIEDFRDSNLRSDLEALINKSEAISKIKKEKKEKLSGEDKKKLTKEEKEYRNKRDEIQKKLKQFAKKIPVFMYLTDNRERTLREVIEQLESELFRKVTNITLKEFGLLVSIGVFNSANMDEAVISFRLYEDQSLSYTGIATHNEQVIGGFNTIISRADLYKMFMA